MSYANKIAEHYLCLLIIVIGVVVVLLFLNFQTIPVLVM